MTAFDDVSEIDFPCPAGLPWAMPPAPCRHMVRTGIKADTTCCGESERVECASNDWRTDRVLADLPPWTTANLCRPDKCTYYEKEPK